MATLSPILKQATPVVVDHARLGLMQAVEFSAWDGTPDPATAAAVQQAAITENLLTLTCGPDGNVVRLIPALVVTAEEIAAGVARFEAALATVLGDTAPASLAQVS